MNFQYFFSKGISVKKINLVQLGIVFLNFTNDHPGQLWLSSNACEIVKYGKLHLSQMTCFDYAVNHQSNNISYLKSNFLFSHGLVHIFIHHCIVNCHSTKNCKCLVEQSEPLELLILMMIIITVSKANGQNNEATLTKMKLQH